RTLHADGPAVCAHDTLRNRETKSRSFGRRGRLIVCLEELLEDERHVLRWNPGNGVTDAHLHRVVHGRDRTLQHAATLGELERIREQVAKYLAHAIFVPYDLIGQTR